ncbi:DUF397 domain-containing protein [Streptomyces sp. NPDC053780]|uniref:DUF397 domain-containing protein n=1 Tax=unclassified Streptomyces TaxID=2593676 RepID=UPI003415BDC8
MGWEGRGAAQRVVRQVCSYGDGPEGDSCVEIAIAPRTIHVRDSKNNTAGPQLALMPGAWARFVAYASER